MMKATVLKTFRDKYTKQIYRAGAAIDVTESRAEEINASPGGPFVDTGKKPAKKPQKKEG